MSIRTDVCVTAAVQLSWRSFVARVGIMINVSYVWPIDLTLSMLIYVMFRCRARVRTTTSLIVRGDVLFEIQLTYNFRASIARSHAKIFLLAQRIYRWDSPRLVYVSLWTDLWAACLLVPWQRVNLRHFALAKSLNVSENYTVALKIEIRLIEGQWPPQRHFQRFQSCR
jgi:hypothetical protein